MTATVDTDRCTGCEICEIICPEVFQMHTDGTRKVASVHAESVPEEAVNFCRDAQLCCKWDAIHICEEPTARAKSSQFLRNSRNIVR